MCQVEQLSIIMGHGGAVVVSWITLPSSSHITAGGATYTSIAGIGNVSVFAALCFLPETVWYLLSICQETRCGTVNSPVCLPD